MAQIILQKPRRMWKNCFKRIYKKGAFQLLFYWAQRNHLSWARKSSGASADWAQSRKSFSWATSVLRQFRTFSAKQRISSLLFMLKSNKNPGPLLNGSRTPTGGPRGTMFPLDIPSPQAPSGSIKCLSGMACCYILPAGCFEFSRRLLFCCTNACRRICGAFRPKTLVFHGFS